MLERLMTTGDWTLAHGQGWGHTCTQMNHIYLRAHTGMYAHTQKPSQRDFLAHTRRGWLNLPSLLWTREKSKCKFTRSAHRPCATLPQLDFARGLGRPHPPPPIHTHPPVAECTQWQGPSRGAEVSCRIGATPGKSHRTGLSRRAAGQGLSSSLEEEIRDTCV